MDTRYEEALERARAGVPIDEVFPELKESEDERIRKNCIHFLGLQKAHHADTSEIDECISYLEKQKEQKPSEWSEEDEKMRIRCIEIFDAILKSSYVYAYTQDCKNWCENRLKSLRPQPHWKPSEEQMEALMLAIEGKCAPTSYMSRRLEDLYEALANTFMVECKLEETK